MTQRAHVKPELLRWARETMRLSLEEADKKIRVGEGRVAQWEAGESKPTVNQLRDACRVYKRPLAAFYLPAPPTTFSVPHDYRRLPGETDPMLSPEFLAEFRAARYRRQIALTVSERDEISGDIADLVGSVDISKDVRQYCPEIRNDLLERVTTRQWSNRYDAFNSWREAVEKFGVLVSHFSRVSVDEVRGFAITENPLPLIGLNSSDSLNARIFTLLHEFGHILLGKPGVSNLKQYPKAVSADQRVERWCNAFAAEVLVPTGELLRLAVVHQTSSPREWDEEELEEIANQFSVSHAVVLGRLLTSGKTFNEFYWAKLEAYRLAAEEAASSPSSGFQPVPGKVVRTVGKPFARIVVGAYDRESITASDLAEYLGMRLKHLGKVRDALSLSKARRNEMRK